MNAFIKINQEFECLNCGKFNQKLEKSCRNHCRHCLYSQHLDQDSPGDRLSKCQNLMQPIAAYQDGKKGWMIKHKCQKCGKIIPNKAAPDDDFDLIINLTLDEQTRSYKA